MNPIRGKLIDEVVEAARAVAGDASYLETMGGMACDSGLMEKLQSVIRRLDAFDDLEEYEQDDPAYEYLYMRKRIQDYGSTRF